MKILITGDAGFIGSAVVRYIITCTTHSAIAIQDLGLEKGLLNKAITVIPIPTSAYPTSAKRPAFSVLDKFSAELISGLNKIHWRKQLSSMMDKLV